MVLNKYFFITLYFHNYNNNNEYLIKLLLKVWRWQFKGFKGVYIYIIEFIDQIIKMICICIIF